MKRNFSLLVLALGLLGATYSHAAVWLETQNWNDSWEQKYSDWVNTGFNEDIYTNGRYKGIATDCADAVYMARIIFSFENNLPFVINDSTGGSGKVSNRMSQFDGNSDPVVRVRKFMVYVGDLTSTKTLPTDSYPVVISRQYVRPGTVWSRPRITRENIFNRIFGGTVQEDPGHAELVKNVRETGAIDLIGSTVPKAVRELHTTSSMVFMPVETSTGFRAWKQPSYYGMADQSLPGYSLEQFTSIGKGAFRRNLSSWTNEVQSRLALREETKGENIARQVENVCSLVNSRVDIVLKSDALRQRMAGTCMNASQYDDYSTPSRDKRIKTTLKQLIEVGGGFGLTGPQKAKKLKPFLDQCPAIQIAPGRTVNLYDFSIAILRKDISSDPNDSFEARWGLADSTSNCPKYE